MVQIVKYRACPALFEAKANADLNSIKYWASICNLNYLYFLYESLEYEPSIKLAERLRDLVGIKFILNRFNKLYPQDLYQSYDDIALMKKAINLFDIEGIKFINQKQNFSYLEIYNFVDLKNIEEKIFFTIMMDDVEGVKYLLSEAIIEKRELIEAIKYAYYKESLDIALYLIFIVKERELLNNNAELSQIVISGILRSNPTQNYTMYSNHINELANIMEDSNFPSIAIKSSIESMFNINNNEKKFFLLKNAIYSENNLLLEKKINFKLLADRPRVEEDPKMLIWIF